MLLHRITPDPFQFDKISESNIGQHEDSVSVNCGTLIAKFDRFGKGARRSDFELTIEWSDIEQLIAHFSDNNHPGAIELQNALKASEALVAAGWRAPEISN